MDPLSLIKLPEKNEEKKEKKYQLAQLPEEDVTQANISRTKLALEQRMAELSGKSNIDRAVETINRKPEYFRYTPQQTLAGGKTNKVKQRIIRVMEKQVDPLEPSKHRHKRAPRQEDNLEEPPPVLHSPPKKLTLEEQLAWKIPPCVSNWKNQAGYTVPLDKRVAADGNNLKHVEISDKFAELGEALYTAEKVAREEIKFRNEIILHKQKIQEQEREQNLREKAAKLREERMKKREQSENKTSLATNIKYEDYQRKKEIERQIRLERAGKLRKELS